MELTPPVLSLFTARPKTGRAKPGASNEAILRSFVGEPPEHLKPTESSHRLSVALVWGSDHLLDFQEVEAGETLTIGADPSARMQVFHEVTRLGHLPVLKPRPDGSSQLFLPAGAPVKLRTGGEELSLIQLIERGLAEPIHAPVEGATCTLGLHDRAVLNFGNVQLIARHLRPVSTRPRSPYGPAFWSRVTIYLMTAFTLYRIAAVTDFEALYRSAHSQGAEEIEDETSGTFDRCWPSCDR
jgi:hypothetical protein